MNECPSIPIQFHFLRYNTNLYNGIPCSGHVDISGDTLIPLNNITLYLLTDPKPQGSLFFVGFGSQITNPSTSIVHNLYKQGNITHLSFAFFVSEHKSYSDGTLYFGGVPSLAIVNKQKGSCKVNNVHSTWSCQLNNIIIGNVTQPTFMIHNSNYSYFNPIHGEIYIPEWFFTNVVEMIILKEFIRNGTCVIRRKNDVSLYACDYNVIEKISDISFQFDEFVFHVDKYMFFNCDVVFKCTFLLQTHLAVKDHWVFGTMFMRNYDMEFDYEDKEIRFYTSSNKTFNSTIIRGDIKNSLMKENYSNLIRKCLSVCIGVMLVNLMFVCYMKYKLT